MHYTGTIWRPPYEAYSLLVQVTAGCTHHSCKFCTLYEDLPFKFKLSPFSEVKADLAEASKYYRKIPRIFFTGANPFVLSTEKLKTLAKMVKEYYPFYKTIGCFARITDIMPKSLEELKELRALGYDGITIGVETGDDESLTFMNKGFQSKDVLEQCRKLDEAGISYNFFYLTGIYGAGRGEVGAKKTAMLFNQLNPKIIESLYTFLHILHKKALILAICTMVKQVANNNKLIIMGENCVISGSMRRCEFFSVNSDLL